MKRIIIYSALAIIIPIIIVSIMVSLVDCNGKIGYVYFSMLIASFIFFYSMLVEKYKIFLFIIILLIIVGLVFDNKLLDKPYLGLIGIVLSSFCGYLSTKSRWLYFLATASIMPVMFSTCDVEKLSILIYISCICATVLFSTWLRYRKTKILLYDNY